MRKVPLLAILLFIAAAAVAQPSPKAGDPAERTFAALPGEDKKCPLEQDAYFTYTFAEKPKVGMAVLVIKIFDKDGSQITGYDVLGRSGMPSMKGAHDSGDVPFKLNKKGNYLLPVNIVMPGEWEISVTFLKNRTIIHLGLLKLSV